MVGRWLGRCWRLGASSILALGLLLLPSRDAWAALTFGQVDQTTGVSQVVGEGHKVLTIHLWWGVCVEEEAHFVTEMDLEEGGEVTKTWGWSAVGESYISGVKLGYELLSKWASDGQTAMVAGKYVKEGTIATAVVYPMIWIDPDGNGAQGSQWKSWGSVSLHTDETGVFVWVSPGIIENGGPVLGDGWPVGFQPAEGDPGDPPYPPDQDGDGDPDETDPDDDGDGIADVDEGDIDGDGIDDNDDEDRDGDGVINDLDDDDDGDGWDDEDDDDDSDPDVPGGTPPAPPEIESTYGVVDLPGWDTESDVTERGWDQWYHEWSVAFHNGCPMFECVKNGVTAFCATFDEDAALPTWQITVPGGVLHSTPWVIEVDLAAVVATVGFQSARTIMSIMLYMIWIVGVIVWFTRGGGT